MDSWNTSFLLGWSIFRLVVGSVKVTIIQCQLIYPPGNDQKNPSWEKENHWLKKCLSNGDVLTSQQGKSNIPFFFEYTWCFGSENQKPAALFRFSSGFFLRASPELPKFQCPYGVEKDQRPWRDWDKWAILVGVDRDPYGVLYSNPSYKWVSYI